MGIPRPFQWFAKCELGWVEMHIARVVVVDCACSLGLYPPIKFKLLWVHREVVMPLKLRLDPNPTKLLPVTLLKKRHA